MTSPAPRSPTSTSTATANEKPLAICDRSEGSVPDTLDLSDPNSTVKLDHLGPMVVNADGSLSVIGNWQNMAAVEKENTLRIIGKRNKMRLEALKLERGGDKGTEGEAEAAGDVKQG